MSSTEGQSRRLGREAARQAALVLLSLANYGDMARVQTVGAQHAVPVSEVTVFCEPQ